ncbi:B22R-like protein [Carp edema virus]|nr:B22R-like protein [Carp edema virus]
MYARIFFSAILVGVTFVNSENVVPLPDPNELDFDQFDRYSKYGFQAQTYTLVQSLSSIWFSFFGKPCYSLENMSDLNGTVLKDLNDFFQMSDAMIRYPNILAEYSFDTLKKHEYYKDLIINYQVYMSDKNECVNFTQPFYYTCFNKYIESFLKTLLWYQMSVFVPTSDISCYSDSNLTLEYLKNNSNSVDLYRLKFEHLKNITRKNHTTLVDHFNYYATLPRNNDTIQYSYSIEDGSHYNKNQTGTKVYVTEDYTESDFNIVLRQLRKNKKQFSDDVTELSFFVENMNSYGYDQYLKNLENKFNITDLNFDSDLTEDVYYEEVFKKNMDRDLAEVITSELESTTPNPGKILASAILSATSSMGMMIAIGSAAVGPKVQAIGGGIMAAGALGQSIMQIVDFFVPKPRVRNYEVEFWQSYKNFISNDDSGVNRCIRPEEDHSNIVLLGYRESFDNEGTLWLDTLPSNLTYEINANSNFESRLRVVCFTGSLKMFQSKASNYFRLVDVVGQIKTYELINHHNLIEDFDESSYTCGNEVMLNIKVHKTKSVTKRFVPYLVNSEDNQLTILADSNVCDIDPLKKIYFETPSCKFEPNSKQISFLTCGQLIDMGNEVNGSINTQTDIERMSNKKIGFMHFSSSNKFFRFDPLDSKNDRARCIEIIQVVDTRYGSELRKICVWPDRTTPIIPEKRRTFEVKIGIDEIESEVNYFGITCVDSKFEFDSKVEESDYLKLDQNGNQYYIGFSKIGSPVTVFCKKGDLISDKFKLIPTIPRSTTTREMYQNRRFWNSVNILSTFRSSAILVSPEDKQFSFSERFNSLFSYEFWDKLRLGQTHWKSINFTLKYNNEEISTFQLQSQESSYSLYNQFHSKIELNGDLTYKYNVDNANCKLILDIYLEEMHVQCSKIIMQDIENSGFLKVVVNTSSLACDYHDDSFEKLLFDSTPERQEQEELFKRNIDFTPWCPKEKISYGKGFTFDSFVSLKKMEVPEYTKDSLIDQKDFFTIKNYWQEVEKIKRDESELLNLISRYRDLKMKLVLDIDTVLEDFYKTQEHILTKLEGIKETLYKTTINFMNKFESDFNYRLFKEQNICCVVKNHTVVSLMDSEFDDFCKTQLFCLGINLMTFPDLVNESKSDSICFEKPKLLLKDPEILQTYNMLKNRLLDEKESIELLLTLDRMDEYSYYDKNLSCVFWFNDSIGVDETHGNISNTLSNIKTTMEIELNEFINDMLNSKDSGYTDSNTTDNKNDNTKTQELSSINLAQFLMNCIWMLLAIIALLILFLTLSLYKMTRAS